MRRFFVVKARAEDSLLKRAVEACQCFTLHHLGPTGQCYLGSRKQSPAAGAKDSVTAPLPNGISWYGMYDNHEGNGDKRSPSHSGGLKLHKVESWSDHGIKLKTLSETNKATEKGGSWVVLGRPPFRCHVSFMKQNLRLGNCEGTTKSPKVGPPVTTQFLSFLIEMMASHLLILILKGHNRCSSLWAVEAAFCFRLSARVQKPVETTPPHIHVSIISNTFPRDVSLKLPRSSWPLDPWYTVPRRIFHTH